MSFCGRRGFTRKSQLLLGSVCCPGKSVKRMRKERITKSEMAKRMGTSRSQLERLLDPENPHVLLETVQKAATAVGKRLTIGLTDAPRVA